MLAAIKSFFDNNLSISLSTSANEADNKTKKHDKLQLASAALLIEVMKSDFSIDEQELLTLRHLLVQQFSVDSTEMDELIEIISQESEDSNSLHQFTQLINNNYSKEEKQAVIFAMWKIAYADGRIDKYEENIIRKVSELIYVPHKEFIQTKLQAEALAK